MAASVPRHGTVRLWRRRTAVMPRRPAATSMTGIGGDTMTGTPIRCRTRKFRTDFRYFRKCNALRTFPEVRASEVLRMNPRTLPPRAVIAKAFAGRTTLLFWPRWINGAPRFRAFYINKDANDNRNVEYDRPDDRKQLLYLRVNQDDYDVGDVPDTELDIGNAMAACLCLWRMDGLQLFPRQIPYRRSGSGL